jgi:hypothetical protein
MPRPQFTLRALLVAVTVLACSAAAVRPMQLAIDVISSMSGYQLRCLSFFVIAVVICVWRLAYYDVEPPLKPSKYGPSKHGKSERPKND